MAPKRKKLKEAEAELGVTLKALNEKRAQLKIVLDKLQALNDDFDAKVEKKRV